MKKLYALLMLALPMLGFAQNDVTFIVDMNNYSGSTANGVYVNGNWNSWCGYCNPMSDPEGDGVWTVTLPLPATMDSIEWKFTVDGWTASETFTSGDPCTITDASGQYTNRFAVISGDTILPGYEYNSCSGAAGKVYMTFQVNMSYTAVDTTGVWLAGGTGFGNPGVNEMYPVGDSVYSKTLRADTGFYSMFTFLSANDPSWGAKENIVGKPCAAGTYSDRDMVGYSATSGLMGDFHYRTCFGQCTTDGSCAAPAAPQNYTFQVDLNGIAGTFTTPYVTGTMDGWSGGTHAMSDADADGVWDVTIALLPGAYEYKFTYDNWAGQENFDPTTADSVCTLTTGAFTNRLVSVVAGADSTLDVNCWEECGACSGIGLGENAAALSVMPNPASDVLYFENTTGETARVLVFDITGALVRNINVEGEARLDVSAMPRGMYIVRMQTATSEKVVRVALN
jgi:hypothetical protein